MGAFTGAIGNVIGSKALIDMAMGYARSRALCAAARLGVADIIGEGEASVDQLAALCGADRDSLYRLLRALASFGIVSESAPSRFALTPLGAPLRKSAPDSVWAAVVFWSDLLADGWSYLLECVRTGDTAAVVMKREGILSRWAKDPDASAIFRAVMGTAPAEDYKPIAQAWNFSEYGVVADLGGGGGSLILAILEECPDVRGMLVDRPESIESAASRFAADGLAARCSLVAADLTSAVPAGADVYLLKHVLHGYSDDSAVTILRNCRMVIPPAGRLLVVEFVLPDLFNIVDRGLEERAMSDLNMLVVTGGKERSAVEWKQLLERSGFTLSRVVPVAGQSVSIVEATVRDVV